MRPVVLTGPPGSGKSALAPRVAVLLGVPSVDLDREVERRAGRTVREIFAQEGEPGFRAREAQALDELLGREGQVIAVGGGTLTVPRVRRDVLRRATVIGLTAPSSVLVRRTASDPARPLLYGASDPVRAMDDLLSLRAEGYAEVHASVEAGESNPDAVAARVVAALEARVVVVPLGARTYRVRVAPLQSLQGVVDGLPGRPISRVVVISDAKVWRHWGPAVTSALGRTPVAQVIVRPGERSKCMAAVTRVWDAALEARADRDTAIVAVGGGVVTDLGGFAAATLLRGIRWVSVATSLLGMVDASVGGKTAVDHPAGKNLIGAFHHPSAVLLDPSLLATLPAREFRSGLAEVVKIALVRDPVLLDILESNAALLRRGSVNDLELLSQVVLRAVQAKADVVGADEREQGERIVLNFGHTVGHALEAASGYRLRHGEAVAVGMRAALILGRWLGVTQKPLEDGVTELLASLGLPTRAVVPYETAKSLLFSDKKRVDGGLRFVLVGAPGHPQVQAIRPTDAFRALRHVLQPR